ncbi:hypothetical protein TNCV_2894411 [Trichonephila clavipes]|nr:hypothetical protein TNCV_2894411 [Trichonephila clavipes]
MGSEAFHLSSPSISHTRGLAAGRLFRVPQSREGTIHLQTSIPSPGERWYLARTRDKASHDSIPIPLGYRGHIPSPGMARKGMDGPKSYGTTASVDNHFTGDATNRGCWKEQVVEATKPFTSHSYAPLRSAIQDLETLPEVFFWNGVQRPRHVSLDGSCFIIPSKNTKLPNPEVDLHPHVKTTPPPYFNMEMEEFLFHINLWGKIPQFIIYNSYTLIGTKNVEFSVIPINLLLNVLKLNPKNLFGSMNHGGGSVPALGCKSAPELGNLVFFDGIRKQELYLNI